MLCDWGFVLTLVTAPKRDDLRQYRYLLFTLRFQQWRFGRVVLGRVRQRVAQLSHTLGGDIQDRGDVGLGVLGQSFEIVIDRGNSIRQGIQHLPLRHLLAPQQVVLDIALAGLQHVAGASQGHHVEAAANLAQNPGHLFQTGVVPLGGHKLNNGVFYLLQPTSRFTHHGNQRAIQLLLGFLAVVKQGLLGLGFDGRGRLQLGLGPCQLGHNILNLSRGGC